MHSILSENSQRLSRTYQGRSEAGSSSEKQPLLLSGNALRVQVALNERDVHKFVYEQVGISSWPSASDIHQILIRIAELTGRGLLPRGLFRTWSIVSNQASISDGSPISGPATKVEPDLIPAVVEQFCDSVQARWSELTSDPVPLAAWAEWELNGGRIHPFYDGCGRASRSFSAALLVQAKHLLPLFDDPSSYFDAGNAGMQAFEKYYRERISACWPWIKKQPLV